MLLSQFFIKVKNKSEEGFSIIRQVDFIEGLNIISDKTINPQSSGNNVGKTTFIKLIKFCLGSDIKDNLFKDKELKTENAELKEKIKDYFFELTIKDEDNNSITLIRDLYGNNSINGAKKSNEEYALNLREILFGLCEDYKKPTLGELLVKFIKVDIEQITNLFRINHATTTNHQYEAMWLLLFGYQNIKDLSNKSEVINKVKQILKGKNDSALNSLEQKLPILQSTLLDLQNKSKKFKIQEYVAEKIQTISQMQASISSLKEELNYLSIEIKDYEKQKLLINNSSEVNYQQIEAIYKSAKVDLPNLSSNFDKVINFYNSMISNKLNYINNKLLELNNLHKERKKELDNHLEKEKKVMIYLKNKKDFGEYESINNDILEVSKNIEATETRISIIQEATSEYSSLENKIHKIQNNFISFKEKYSENLKIFNKYFTDYTYKIYNEKYFILIEEGKNKYFDIKEFLLAIDGLDNSPSTGDKRSLIYLFDLAYLNFSIEKKLKVPYFFLHDQLETIYYKNIEKLFEITKNTKGQCIVSLLSDKIKDFEIPVKPVLELSQEDKLFKV